MENCAIIYCYFLIFQSRLEKEYTTIKNKEMEEQIEIKVRLFYIYAWLCYD